MREFKVGERYKIVDIDAWWDKEAYDCVSEVEEEVEEFQNGDILTVVLGDLALCFMNDKGRESQDINVLMHDKNWHDSCVELIEEQGE